MRDLNESSQSLLDVLSQPTVHRALLFESVMSVVWSRQREVQRTFGTIAGLVSQVRSEGALCECHELKVNFGANLSQSCVLCTQDS